jgi:hypothetical protein
VAANRQQLIHGQGRLDAAHIRALESGVCFDFDVLAGAVLSGGLPAVVRGFDVVTTGAVGAPASNLVVNVASAVVTHVDASESGTVFTVPEDRAAEVLGPTNGRVHGGFVAGATNYVGVDFTRKADDATSDVVKFIDGDPETAEESARLVPLARTIDYRFVISTIGFASSPNVLPVAIVQTDSSTHVVSVVDARHLLFRLGRGGDAPTAINPYSWPLGRTEALGGDRAISSQRAWTQAAMTRIWEIGGGPSWFSPTADRNVKLGVGGTTFAAGDYYEWDGTNLHWRGLVVLFDNSPAGYNDVLDQLTDLTGLTDLADGDCLYVDVDRNNNRTGGTALQPVKAPMVSLGQGAVPGSRFVLAWRHGSNVFTRGGSTGVGQPLAVPAASKTVNGVIRTSATPPVPLAPVAAITDAGGRAIATGLTRAGAGGPGAGALALGDQTTDTSVSVGHGASTGTTVHGAATAALALDLSGLELILTADTTPPANGRARLILRLNTSVTPNLYQVGMRWPDGSFTSGMEWEVP